jgi:transposase
MAIFFRQLCLRLDRERPQWRRDTVILMDNAPYHCGEDIMKLYKDLDLPVMFLGPHSYDAAPVELFFAAFKAADVNPGHVPTGKR